MALPPLHHLVSLSDDWFAGLPEALRGDFRARSRRCVLAPGQRLYARGDGSDGIYGVLEGSIRMGGVSGDGRETVLDFYGPGAWFGEVETLDGLPRVYDAHACGSTALLQVAPADLDELLAAHPELGRALLRLEAHRVRILSTVLESYSTQTLEQRLASRLLRLAASHVVTARGSRIELHLSQKSLAQLIGATRQRVNQILKDWKRDRVVEQQHGRILLLNRPRLEKLARM